MGPRHHPEKHLPIMGTLDNLGMKKIKVALQWKSIQVKVVCFAVNL